MFPPTIPISFEERDKVKLRERLVQGCSPFVGEHEQGVVAAGTSDADKLPQGVQEVLWTCDGREELKMTSLIIDSPSSRKIRVLCVVPSFIMRVT